MKNTPHSYSGRKAPHCSAVLLALLSFEYRKCSTRNCRNQAFGPSLLFLAPCRVVFSVVASIDEEIAAICPKKDSCKDLLHKPFLQGRDHVVATTKTRQGLKARPLPSPGAPGAHEVQAPHASKKELLGSKHQFSNMG